MSNDAAAMTRKRMAGLSPSGTQRKVIDVKELNAVEELEIQMWSARFWDAGWAIPVIPDGLLDTPTQTRPGESRNESCRFKKRKRSLLRR